MKEAQFLLFCLRIIYVCISADEGSITKPLRLLLKAATFGWGRLTEHLQHSAFFTDKVFNLYFVYMSVFLPFLFSAQNAPRKVSTQYNEALWGPIRRLLESRGRHANRVSLLQIAEHLAGRTKCV